MRHAIVPKLHNNNTASKSISKTKSRQSRSRNPCRCSCGLLVGLVTFLILQQFQTLGGSIAFPRLDLSLPSWRFPSFRGNKLPNEFLSLKDLSLANAPLAGNTWFMSSINDTFEAGDLSLPSWRLPSFRGSKLPNEFLPLKDLSLANAPWDGNTWFMSSINDTFDAGEAEYLHFPSYQSEGRLLCLGGNSTRNGTLNSYALVHPEKLPPGSRLVPGITFVSESYYGYDNICHGLFAMMPFAAWHYRKGCVRPARWVLYQRGEVRREISNWLRNFIELTFGEEMMIEKFETGGKVNYSTSCFEEAVVFRHNEGKMLKDKKIQVYEMVRCKSRNYCKISERDHETENVIKLTLLLRSNSRSFKDEAGVINVFRKECAKVKACRLKVTRPDNLTFCDQVKMMRETDILASPHGAQLTNLFFMDKNSSVMEFFPKGWKDLAGPGQFVYQWISAYSGMRHVGTWHDPKGDKCPYSDKAQCMSFYKNRQIGIDEHFLSNWTSSVLKEAMARKLHTLKVKRVKEWQCKCS